MPTNFPTAVDSFPTAATLAGHNLSTDPHSTLHGNLGLAVAAIEPPLLGPIWYNAKGYGAVGDGSTDDRVAIQLALTAANAAGGGVVYLPAGTYIVSVAAHPDNAAYFAGLLIGTNVSLVGAGRTVTTIKLKASQTGGSASGNSAVLMNLSINAGNARMRVADLTIDGNNVNQSTAIHNGITWRRVSDTVCERVTVKNCHGTSTSTYLESGHFHSANCSGISFYDCLALSDAGVTASGFHHSGTTNLTLVNCRGVGMTVANGFTHADCRNVAYVGCIAHDNASVGFNCESSTDVTYTGCIGGGKATADSTPFSANEVLGNLHGFAVAAVSTRVTLVGCIASNNTNGFVGDASPDLFITGSLFSNNTVSGFTCNNVCSGKITASGFVGNTTNGANFSDTASAEAFRFHNCTFNGNGTPVTIPTVGNINPTGFTYAVPVAATTVAVTNPFPFDATVHITGGTVTAITVNGTTTGLTTGTFRVAGAGGTISWTGTVAPTWKWFLD